MFLSSDAAGVDWKTMACYWLQNNTDLWPLWVVQILWLSGEWSQKSAAVFWMSFGRKKWGAPTTLIGPWKNIIVQQGEDVTKMSRKEKENEGDIFARSEHKRHNGPTFNLISYEAGTARKSVSIGRLRQSRYHQPADVANWYESDIKTAFWIWWKRSNWHVTDNSQDVQKPHTRLTHPTHQKAAPWQFLVTFLGYCS